MHPATAHLETLRHGGPSCEPVPVAIPDGRLLQHSLHLLQRTRADVDDRQRLAGWRCRWEVTSPAVSITMHALTAAQQQKTLRACAIFKNAYLSEHVLWRRHRHSRQVPVCWLVRRRRPRRRLCHRRQRRVRAPDPVSNQALRLRLHSNPHSLRTGDMPCQKAVVILSVLTSQQELWCRKADILS